MKLKPFSALCSVNAELTPPVTVSGPAAVFFIEMEPLMEPEIVMAMLVSVPIAGLNWEQVIGAADSSVI